MDCSTDRIAICQIRLSHHLGWRHSLPRLKVRRWTQDISNRIAGLIAAGESRRFLLVAPNSYTFQETARRQVQ